MVFCPDLDIGMTEITGARADKDAARAALTAADRLVLLPRARDFVVELIGADALAAKTVVDVPGFYFSGYHPDVCYVRSSKGDHVKTRFGAYHSVICLSAFLHGLSVEQTVKLYNAQTYAACGYFGEWDKQRNLLLATFAKAGLDIAAPMLRWSRGGCFMHTVNHPHVQCLFDVARVIAAKLDTRTVDFYRSPADSLGNNSIYPCYPEIAENCGVTGSTLFKLNKKDEVVDLAGFIELSFYTYSRHPREDLNFSPEYSAKAAAMARVFAGPDLQTDL
jgi:hypothetical protein